VGKLYIQKNEGENYYLKKGTPYEVEMSKEILGKIDKIVLKAIERWYYSWGSCFGCQGWSYSQRKSIWMAAKI
jgi:hypothetical protein